MKNCFYSLFCVTYEKLSTSGDGQDLTRWFRRILTGGLSIMVDVSHPNISWLVITSHRLFRPFCRMRKIGKNIALNQYNQSMGVSFLVKFTSQWEVLCAVCGMSKTPCILYICQHKEIKVMTSRNILSDSLILTTLNSDDEDLCVLARVATNMNFV